jgi:hypothetical protein
MTTGARSPEELETLLEDTLMIGDGETLAGLFEDGAVLVWGNGLMARGVPEIVSVALDARHGFRAYVADPRRILQARDIALIVADQGINVMRRGHDGAWRYAIAVLSIETILEGPWHKRPDL